MDRVTKKSIEADLANAMGKFQREQQGRGAVEVRVNLIGDMIVVRSGGIFTATETHLAVSEDGRRLIRSARQELRSINRSELESIVARIVGTRTLRSYYDVDVDHGEQIDVFILAEDVEQRMLRDDLDRLTHLAPQTDGIHRRR